MRYGMVINLHKCVGCYSCVIKCKQEHFLPPDMTWAKLMIAETGVCATFCNQNSANPFLLKGLHYVIQLIFPQGSNSTVTANSV